MSENKENCRVYACVNQKGGVGKTVSSTNLAVGLARRGKKVLIVDLDSRPLFSPGSFMDDET